MEQIREFLLLVLLICPIFTEQNPVDSHLLLLSQELVVAVEVVMLNIAVLLEEVAVDVVVHLRFWIVLYHLQELLGTYQLVVVVLVDLRELELELRRDLQFI